MARPSNVRVDAAARIKAPSAASDKLRNAHPPLASSDLLLGNNQRHATHNFDLRNFNKSSMFAESLGNPI